MFSRNIHNKGRSIMEKILKDYFEDLCTRDALFEEKYDETQIEDCIKYITELANDQADGNHEVAITSFTVFAWARDFFVIGEAEIEKEKKRKEEEERKKRELERIRIEQEKREKKRYEQEHKNGQLTIFDLGA